MTRAPSHCPNCGHPVAGSLDHDKRAARWRVRVRLWDMTKPDEPAGDSDPELAADQPGTEICAGLKGVADYVVQLAVFHHKTAELVGMDTATLDAKIDGLRTTLSRHNTNPRIGARRAIWRLHYDTLRTWSNDPNHKPVWYAQADIEQVDEETAPPERLRFRRPA